MANNSYCYYDSSLSHQVAVMLPICTFILRILLAAQVFACVQSELGIRDLFIDSASLGPSQTYIDSQH